MNSQWHCPVDVLSLSLSGIFPRSVTSPVDFHLNRQWHQHHLGYIRSGQVRSGQVRSGQVRSGQVRSGQRHVPMDFRIREFWRAIFWPEMRDSSYRHSSKSVGAFWWENPLDVEFPENDFWPYGQFSKAQSGKWAQPLGDLNFQRACWSAHKQWLWDLSPSI